MDRKGLIARLQFNLMIANLKERLKKRGKGGVVLRESRLYSLAYVHEVVLLAEEESGMGSWIIWGWTERKRAEYVRENFMIDDGGGAWVT